MNPNPTLRTARAWPLAIAIAMLGWAALALAPAAHAANEKPPARKSAAASVTPTAMPPVMPSFQKFRNGNMWITALYDGYMPVLVSDLHGAPAKQMNDLLKAAMLPPDGDLLTSVNSFLVELDGSKLLVDAGGGDALGPHTGKLLKSLQAAGHNPMTVNHILLTDLQPDHLHGLLLDNGQPAFPRAQIHAPKEEVDYWLDSKRAAAASGAQKEVFRLANEALAPYVKSGGLRTFRMGQRPLPGVRSVALDGHTPGHTGYLFGAGKDEILFWGDTVHSYAVQLPLPQVTVDSDVDASRAIASRQAILQRAVARQWLVGAAHLPFPGLGHVRKKDAGYEWVPELRQSNGRPPGSQ